MQKKAEALVKKLDLNGLRDLWLRTRTVKEDDGKILLRKLVMDRLEELNPTAFEIWLDQEDELDFSVFKK